ncbi:MAG: ABC transporter ATP-binding protein [Oscillospiraceae bacterium]|nr:ABC transporter ATP-binding protein [Oscillospiraceae bacterium]
MSNIIKAEQLSKSYGKKIAVDKVSLNISDDCIVGLIGRNGAGKTTLMKMIAGLLDTTEGVLEVFGKPSMDNLGILENIVFTYHDLEYAKHSRLVEIIDAYSTMYPNFDKGFAIKLLNYFSLDSKLKYKALSQGMASIFNFICGISCRAKLTMLDEPVLGMDVTVRKAAYEVLLHEFNENPRTIIISSHLLSEIESILSDIILIDEGKLILFDNIDDMRQSAYRVAGEQSDVEKFIENKNVIDKKVSLGDSCEAIIYEKLTDTPIDPKLTVSAVRAEDLCIYLTKENKEGELKCLWE